MPCSRMRVVLHVRHVVRPVPWFSDHDLSVGYWLGDPEHPSCSPRCCPEGVDFDGTRGTFFGDALLQGACLMFGHGGLLSYDVL